MRASTDDLFFSWQASGGHQVSADGNGFGVQDSTDCWLCLEQASGWEQVSADAKDLVKRLLDRDHKTRITAEEAWQHPWLQENCHEEEGCDLANELYEMSALSPANTPPAWHETPAGSHLVRNAWAHHL